MQILLFIYIPGKKTVFCVIMQVFGHFKVMQNSKYIVFPQNKKKKNIYFELFYSGSNKLVRRNKSKP